MTRRNLLITSALVLTPLLLIVALIIAERSGTIESGLVASVASAVGMSEPSIFDEPQQTWTASITEMIDAGRWDELAEQTSRFVDENPEIARSTDLAYLNARALIEAGRAEEALTALEPFLADRSSTLRPFALHHAARAHESSDDPGTASRLRRELIETYPESLYADDAVESEAAWLLETDPEAAIAWLDQVADQVSDSWKRRLIAWKVEALLETGQESSARQEGFALLDDSVADDAAEHVFELFDETRIDERATPREQYLLARTAHSHRHFARALELLHPLRRSLPSESDDINFAIGRAHFWSENFEDAETAYLYGARNAKARSREASFYYHASRAAQLRGDDARAEELMTRAIAVRGNFDSTAAALSQRLRTRASQKRWAEAGQDLDLIRRLFPNSDTLEDASLSYAIHAIASDRRTAARSVLNRVSTRRLNDYQRAEYSYWLGRSWEGTDALEALDAYLDVLQSEVTSYYKFFARERIDSNRDLRNQARASILRRKVAVDEALEAGRLDEARRLQQQIVLLAGPTDQGALERLREIYRQIPVYSTIVDLEPEQFPEIPLTSAGEGGDTENSIAARLMAIGLYDEAIPTIDEIYPLRPAKSALTQAEAANRAGATKPSIYAAEVMMRAVPDDYLVEALPRSIMERLYPRYFEDLIAREAAEHGADPRLVISIMREESRFDPRAKSFAAARGLLQFIITTARDIGSKIGLEDLRSDDLYDPETIVSLGGRYVGDLMKEFEGDLYKTAAAYNAGPAQARLWSRLAPADESDYFLATVYFDETKGYVRKVLTSYKRYQDLYGEDLFQIEPRSEEINNESYRADRRGSEESDEGERVRQDINPPSDPERAEE